ncbi:GTP-binding protein rbg1 [Gnomoniopsis smithogilvyi]|uniref:GTP-binding protein rbg1 n=1 Tax=Gnomoniopsis smithogilvyi TaxID=1191159 RepID=A0A9W8YSA9_9PEZI|nr:GTP-binding protein rbg1 [Gnomoniopsis smithogilvyi]
MATTVDKIKDIEAEMSKTQKNSSFALEVSSKLAKLKRELLTPSSSGGGGGGQGFDVARTGVASVGFIGFPSVGKSTLMSKLTGQHSEAAAYEFTTLTSVPGQVTYNGAPLQMIDLPGIIEGAKDGRGRGRQVIAVAKTCHLIFIVLDVNKPLTDKRVIETELEGFGIRINKTPPNITIKKKDKGGLNITSTSPLTHIDQDEIKAVMNEYKMSSADITIRCDATIDDLIDVIEARSRSYIPVIYVLNKIDAISIEELDLLYRIPNAVPISSEQGWNIDELMEAMWEKLKLVRVYTKPKGKMPDYDAPVVLRSTRCTVEDFCNAIHRTIVENFKGAIVYGKSVKHQPQRVGLSHELADEDIGKFCSVIWWMIRWTDIYQSRLSSDELSICVHASPFIWDEGSFKQTLAFQAIAAISSVPVLDFA